MMRIIKHPRWHLKASDVTDEKIYKERRDIMKIAALTTASTLMPLQAQEQNLAGKDLNYIKNGKFQELETTSYDKISTYNNFYEFSLSKEEPAKLAHTLQPEPWSIEITGEVQKPMSVDINTIVSNYPLEERIYRFRCVEGWSMTVPWIGFELSYLLKKAGLTSKSHYVEFETKYDPKMFPQQGKHNLFSSNIPFPYLEGLRIDEAMNPLTLLSVGLYGKTLPKQNGAPIRLVLPWKYGFKSIKSIAKIRVMEKPSRSTWNIVNPREYGFYANVNPDVDHPRWSQAKERVLGKFFKQKTLSFNGYEAEVSSLYKDMDLRKFF